jgi:hypothetical protein
MYGQYPHSRVGGDGAAGKRVSGVLYYYYHRVECWVVTVFAIVQCWIGHRLHTLFVFQIHLNQRPVRTYYWGLRYKWIALFVLYFIYSRLVTSCIFASFVFHNQYCLLEYARKEIYLSFSLDFLEVCRQVVYFVIEAVYFKVVMYLELFTEESQCSNTLRTVHTRKLVLAVLDASLHFEMSYSSATYSVVVRRIERAREAFTGTSKLDQSYSEVYVI